MNKQDVLILKELSNCPDCQEKSGKKNKLSSKIIINELYIKDSELSREKITKKIILNEYEFRQK